MVVVLHEAREGDVLMGGNSDPGRITGMNRHNVWTTLVQTPDGTDRTVHGEMP
jgi:hypothetical protein